ncbi:MAG TPA: hypothetical protein VK171_01535 [Fimbriimonas sp.]|nr:hypothetical protein [Fimbriimonas sp.]
MSTALHPSEEFAIASLRIVDEQIEWAEKPEKPFLVSPEFHEQMLDPESQGHKFWQQNVRMVRRLEKPDIYVYECLPTTS